MHVLSERRGLGLSRQLLVHLLAAAQAAGMTQVSLETGAQPAFAAARVLYDKAGFGPCAPFSDYVDDPHSVFMNRALG